MFTPTRWLRHRPWRYRHFYHCYACLIYMMWTRMKITRCGKLRFFFSFVEKIWQYDYNWSVAFLSFLSFFSLHCWCYFVLKSSAASQTDCDIYMYIYIYIYISHHVVYWKSLRVNLSIHYPEYPLADCSIRQSDNGGPLRPSMEQFVNTDRCITPM